MKSRVSLSAMVRRLLALPALLLALMTLMPIQAAAEGSRTLFPAGYSVGGRGVLSVGFDNGLYAGVARNKTFLYVYAQAGERILLGSRNLGNGGDVLLYVPQSFGTRGDETIPATADFSCSTAGGGAISDRNAELAGPNSADGTATVPNGYAPCVYVVPATGIYGVLFTGATANLEPNDGAIDPPRILGNSLVSAWDVTVRASASSLADLDGRLFTYSWVVNTGGNGAAYRLYNSLYYASIDGYRYRQTLRGIDPYAGAFYANSSGFLDDGAPLYKDVRGDNQAVSSGISFSSGISAQRPQYPLFFSDIGATAPNVVEAERTLTALGIPLAPPPPEVSSITFEGNISGSTSAYSAGGVFQFTAVNTLTYQIVISLDGIDFDPANPSNKTLTGVAGTGIHRVLWDGSGNDEVPFPSGNYQYRVTGRSGEIHFPMVDIEGNVNGGPTLQKLNGTQDSTVFFDDRGYRTRSGVLIGTLNGHLCGAGNAEIEPVPTHSLLGINSADPNYAGSGHYFRYWDGSIDFNNDCYSDAQEYFGTAKALDLWAVESTTALTGPITIIPLGALPDVSVVVAVAVSAAPGDTVYGSVHFSNGGVNPATGVTYTTVIGTPGNCPTGLSFTLLPPGVTTSYNTSTCAVTYTGMPASLASGDTVDVNFSYTAPLSGPIPLNATIDSIEDPLAGSPRAGQPSPNTDSAQTIISGSTTALTILKTANEASVFAGNTVSYTIVVSNTGPSDAASVLVTDTTPAGLSFVSNSGDCATAYPCNLGTIPNGETRTITTTYQVPADYSGANPISNTATVNSPTDPGAPHSSTATTPVSANAVLTILKTANEAGVIAGNTASYTIVVSNTGPSDAASVVVADTTPAGLTFVSNSGDCTTAYPCNLGTLAAGQNRTITTTFQVPANYAGANPISNTASVTSPTDPGSPRTSTATTPVSANAALTILKTANEASVIPGNTASYTIVVSNTGPSDAASVVVADTTPAGLSFVSNSGACTTAYPCNLGTLPAGQNRTITTTFQVPANYAGANPISNTASVTSPTDPGSPRTSTATTPVGAASATLTILKTANEANVIPGNTASYTIVVSNTGPSDAASVIVADTTPAGLSFVSNSGACTTAYPCNLGTLPAGQNRTITTTFQVPPDYAGANPISNTASVTSPTDPGSPRTSTATTPVGAASATLTILKTANEANVIPGNTASYTIVVSNTGPSDAASVIVADTTPAGLSFVSNSGACTTAYPCNLGTIPNGASRTITTTFQVPPDYAGANPISNTASVTSPTDPGSPRTSTATTPVGTASATLTILKTANEANVIPGNTASYTIVVSNTGPSDATSVVVSDTTPAGLSFVSNSGACTTAYPCNLGTIPNGASRTITTTFQVPPDYAGANPISNTASVTSPTDPGSPRTSTATTPVGTASATLTILKTANEANVIPGNTASYTIVVSNTGPSDATSVVVSDTTPAGLSFVSNSGACTTAYPCNLGTIANGASRTITTTFQVPPDYAGANPISNTASVTSPTDPGSPRTSTATTPVGTASATLTILKTANEASVFAGNTASYTIVVSNTGPSDATNVVVADTTPAGLSFVSNSGACTTAYPCNLGTIPNGASRTITTTFQVPPTMPARTRSATRRR